MRAPQPGALARRALLTSRGSLRLADAPWRATAYLERTWRVPPRLCALIQARPGRGARLRTWPTSGHCPPRRPELPRRAALSHVGARGARARRGVGGGSGATRPGVLTTWRARDVWIARWATHVARVPAAGAQGVGTRTHSLPRPPHAVSRRGRVSQRAGGGPFEAGPRRLLARARTSGGTPRPMAVRRRKPRSPPRSPPRAPARRRARRVAYAVHASPARTPRRGPRAAVRASARATARHANSCRPGRLPPQARGF